MQLLEQAVWHQEPKPFYIVQFCKIETTAELHTQAVLGGRQARSLNDLCTIARGLHEIMMCAWLVMNSMCNTEVSIAAVTWQTQQKCCSAPPNLVAIVDIQPRRNGCCQKVTTIWSPFTCYCNIIPAEQAMTFKGVVTCRRNEKITTSRRQILAWLQQVAPSGCLMQLVFSHVQTTT